MPHFNFKRQYKIWFSPNPAEFLPMRHQLRLIHTLKVNPGIELRLLYSRGCLSANALRQLEVFCSKYGIIPLALESIVATTPAEQRLMEIAFQEIELFEQNAGGNLGAASDCVRLLRSVIEVCGVYSDLDVRTSLFSLFKQSDDKSYWCQTLGPVLFFGTQIPLEGRVSLMCNNDFLAFSLQGPRESQPLNLSSEAMLCLNSIQSAVIHRYSLNLSMASFIHISNYRAALFAKYAESAPALAKFMEELSKDTRPRTLFFIRKQLIDLMSLHPEEEIQHFLNDYLKQSVTEFSGPEIFANLFSHLISNRWVDHIVSQSQTNKNLLDTFLKSSIGYYDPINDCVMSNNDWHRVRNAMASGLKPGGDLAWLPRGQTNMLSDEEKLKQAAHTIGFFWRKKRPLQLVSAGASRILATPALLQAIEQKNYGLALRRAVVGGESAAVQSLLYLRKIGCIQFDINTTSSNGRTALDWAMMTPTMPTKIKNKMIALLQQEGARAVLTLPMEPSSVVPATGRRPAV